MCQALCEVIMNKMLCLSAEGTLVNKTPDVNHKGPSSSQSSWRELEPRKEQEKRRSCDGSMACVGQGTNKRMTVLSGKW